MSTRTPFCTAPPTTFLKLLKETEAVEGQSATLTCKLSQPDAEVTWFKDGKPIAEDEGHVIEVDKLWRRLRIEKCAFDDEAEYSVQLADDFSRAMLWVEGQCPGVPARPIWFLLFIVPCCVADHSKCLDCHCADLILISSVVFQN